MKLLAYTHRTGEEIAHAGFVGDIKGGLRKDMLFFHLVDRTPMHLSRIPLLGARFNFDQNSTRADHAIHDTKLRNPVHELVQAELCKSKVWAFQHRGEKFVLNFDAVDDAEIKCPIGFHSADVTFVITATCPYCTQFRGRLLLLINSDPKSFTEQNRKRVAAFIGGGFYVAELRVPALIDVSKSNYTPYRLAALRSEVQRFLASEPEVTFLSKPGWVAGERVTSGTVHNDPLTAIQTPKFNFSKSGTKPSLQDKADDIREAFWEIAANLGNRVKSALKRKEQKPEIKLRLPRE